MLSGEEATTRKVLLMSRGIKRDSSVNIGILERCYRGIASEGSNDPQKPKKKGGVLRISRGDSYRG